jgi:hypothetical protein
MLNELRRPACWMSETDGWHSCVGLARPVSKKRREHIGWFATPEEAIETACGLSDDCCDVYGIGSGSLDDTIARDQIVRIYDLWARVKPRRK